MLAQQSNYFFLSLLYNKFIGKLFYSGNKQKIELILFNAIFILNTLNITKKSFFFIFFHLFENLSVNFTLASKRKGRRIYQIPTPVFFRLKYKQGLKFCYFVLKDRLKVWRTPSKLNNFIFYFFFNYVLNKKNYATGQLTIFKKKIKSNRIFTHWRWK